MINYNASQEKENNPHKAYRYLGTNDDSDTCCLCNKTELKKVVWLEHVETGSVQCYGSCCAAKLMGMYSDEYKTWIKAEKERIEKDMMEKIMNKYIAIRDYGANGVRVSSIIKNELKTNKIQIKKFNEYLSSIGMLRPNRIYSSYDRRLYKIK